MSFLIMEVDFLLEEDVLGPVSWVVLLWIGTPVFFTGPFGLPVEWPCFVNHVVYNSK